MKKIICLCIILMLMGCSNNKKIVCIRSLEDSGLMINEKLNINFKNDKMNNVVININSEALSDTIKENWDLFVDTIDSEYQNDNYSGITITTSHSGYNYNIKFVVDINTVESNVLEKYDLLTLYDQKDNNYDEIKDSLINNGYSCQ